ncbi:MAG: AAA family ATPase [Pikeienuella sp.]
MRLRALRVHDLRRFAGRGVALEGITDGLNLFAEPNETGKSTLFDALHALVFHKHASVGAQVRSLTPYGGGRPRVCADIEVDGRLYRVEKRFLSRSFARVVDLATGAEIARADAAQDWLELRLSGGAVGPAGLLWVRQGASGELSGARPARAKALEAVVAEELDALTGGRRMRRVVERAQARLAELKTSAGQIRRGGPLWQAAAEARAAAAATADAAAALAAAEADLTALEAARRRLAVAGDPAEAMALAARLTAARAAEQEVRAQAEALAAAEAKRALADLALGQAGAALAAFDGAVEALKSAEAQHGARQTALSAAQARAVTAEAAASAGSAALGVARDRARAQEAALAACRRAALAQIARAEWARLSDRLSAAQDACAEADAARAEAARNQATPARLAEVERCAAAKSEAETAVRLGQLTLVFTALPQAPEGAVRLDGHPLRSGKAIALDGPGRLDLAGLGQLDLTPPAGTGDAAARLGSAEAALARALAAAGGADLATVRAAAARRAERLRAAEAAQARAEVFAPDGLAALSSAVADAAALSAQTDGTEPDLADDASVNAASETTAAGLSVAERAAAEAAAAERAAAAAEEVARGHRAAAAEQVAVATALLVQADTALTAAQNGLPPPQERDRARADLVAALREAEAARRLAVAECARLAEGAGDPALAAAEVARLEGARRSAETLIADLKVEVAKIEERVRATATEGVAEQAAAAEERSARAHVALARTEAEAAALERLISALDAAGASAKARYFAPLERELRPLLRLLYGNAEIRFSEAELAPEAISRRGVEEPVARLSGGTREQIAVLTRLAFARLLAKGGEAPPVILDDALVYSDDDRIEAMFTALHAQVETLQILAFTCRQRAFARLGGTILRLVPWQPDED